MLKLLMLSILQSFCLASGQVALKFALTKMGTFAWSLEWFRALLTNWWFLLTGIAMGGATILWCHILKNFPLSAAYPLTCLSYVFGMIASALLLHESIPLTRWVGVGIIFVGMIFIIK